MTTPDTRDWSYHTERLRYAETHLAEFLFLADNNRSDIALGQNAQKALAHALKALLAAAGSNSLTHDIGILLDNVRRLDRAKMPPRPQGPARRRRSNSLTHDIGILLDNVRRLDPRMADFKLPIPTDVYTEYATEAPFAKRRQPPLTQYPDFKASTAQAIPRIIHRARALRDQTSTS